ncbi:hypothetical protein ElyMa_001031200 [Elysia marginata]|uniref:Ribosomal RNA-processing protein 36 n=1 Tax=Elysia marginata TaxID=1093978 RepID=A0AAV4HQ48_9GAST|nr:hypothetical protein ElyMa_001031200 [Elysia marginata]
MASTSTLYRKRLKEERPEDYARYLERQRVQSKKRLEEEKRRLQEETLTTAQINMIEERKKKKRECARAYYLKKKAALGRQTRNSKKAGVPTSSKLEKRPRDMTEEELRAYKARERKRQRDSRSSQKKTAGSTFVLFCCCF